MGGGGSGSGSGGGDGGGGGGGGGGMVMSGRKGGEEYLQFCQNATL